MRRIRCCEDRTTLGTIIALLPGDRTFLALRTSGRAVPRSPLTVPVLTFMRWVPGCPRATILWRMKRSRLVYSVTISDNFCTCLRCLNLSAKPPASKRLCIPLPPIPPYSSLRNRNLSRPPLLPQSHSLPQSITLKLNSLLTPPSHQTRLS